MIKSKAKKSINEKCFFILNTRLTPRQAAQIFKLMLGIMISSHREITIYSNLSIKGN